MSFNSVKFSTKRKNHITDVGTFYPEDMELLSAVMEPHLSAVRSSRIRTKLQRLSQMGPNVSQPPITIELHQRGVVTFYGLLCAALHDLTSTSTYDCDMILATKQRGKQLCLELRERDEFEEMLVLTNLVQTVSRFVEAGSSLIIRELRQPQLRLVAG